MIEDEHGPFDEYSTPEDIRVERLRQIESDPLRHIIKNQELILNMLEDIVQLLKHEKSMEYQPPSWTVTVPRTWKWDTTASNNTNGT